MNDPNEERKQFYIQIVIAILNQQQFLTEKLSKSLLQDANKHFMEAKDQNLEFYQFLEFIEHKLTRCKYDRDLEFDLTV